MQCILIAYGDLESLAAFHQRKEQYALDNILPPVLWNEHKSFQTSLFVVASSGYQLTGARRAGTLATPYTCIGLLTVNLRFSPAPSSGTTMSLAFNCGSLMTSCGPR